MRATSIVRFGWAEEGIVREAFEDGGVRGSFVQMSILKSEWRKGVRPALVFNQATVGARDLGRSIAFYETLGFRLIVKAAHYARFEIGDGQATFSLHVGDGAANGPHLYFEWHRPGCAQLPSSKRKASSSTPSPWTRAGSGAKPGSAIPPATGCASIGRAITAASRPGG